jgi:tRNA(adenine34) deaminase
MRLTTPMNVQDELFMRIALVEAHHARRRGEVPVGAVLVRQDVVLARGRNKSVVLHDPSAHAEIVALRAGGRRLGNYRLVGTTMYVTLEPCIMCMGALVQARVGRLVIGASDPRAGAAGSVFDLSADARLNHTLQVSAGVLEAESRSLLQDFFKTKRLHARRDGRVG